MNKRSVIPGNRVAYLPSISGNAAKLLVALHVFTDGKGTAWPSNKTLMRITGILTWKGFKQARAELAMHGLTWTPGVGKITTVYHFSESVHKTESARKTETANGCKGESVTIVHRELPIMETTHTPVPHASRKRSTEAEAAAKSKPPVWRLWIDANRSAGRPDPLSVGPDTAASKALGKLIVSGELTEADLKGRMAAYLKDTDTFLQKQGWALRLLPGRIGAYQPVQKKAGLREWKD